MHDNVPIDLNRLDPTQSGFGYTLSLIDGKYTMMVLYLLYYYPPTIRFNALQRMMGDIPHKTLAATLKKMEQDGLVIRTEYPQIPPKVEYSLSEKALSLIPVLDTVCLWGEKWQ
ncbi:MAG: helix-turn-helix domain-containing protein [Moraxella sp.]|nr:helix-turn-helix domain-containing protein [Moraxella sp.]